MDQNHISFIKALADAAGPIDVLEIGFGSGRLTERLMSRPNTIKSYTIVDNFLDFNGIYPEHLRDTVNKNDENGFNIEVVVQNEEPFVRSCTKKFNFIISDADHFRAEQWIEETIGILKPGGFAIFHDVTNPDFRNLAKITEYVSRNGLSHFILNKDLVPGDRCGRGLLVVHKNDNQAQ